MKRTAFRRRTAWLSTVAAVTALALTGCTRTSGDGSAPAAAHRVRDLGYAQDLRISDAEQRLVAGCMGRHGFRYWTDRPLSLAESRPLGYVQDDVHWARTYGYGSRIAAKEDRARLRNPNSAYRKGLPTTRKAAYDTALDGGRRAELLRTDVPGGGEVTKRTGGCDAEAERRLYGDPRTWFRLDTTASNLRPLYVGKLLHDRRFTAAVNAWSACMKRAGHPYPDPDAARQATREHPAVQTRAEEARNFAAEVRIAVADATCARQVSLRSVGRDREAHYLARLDGEYGARLDAYRQVRLRALERAERIVPART
ncbi:MAG: hypothetical protein JF597_10100 [Streptomyces sp.]|jgi:hypothetical protein|uniref:hypothetical protein n=1 Tax=Streptomyces sp. TaxID=1931 RepID=UPI0025DC826C|nr:hypothetical protein [Streptomyces sp.]MBW8793924.1 hypothetical protein [Streptomyces sp.]